MACSQTLPALIANTNGSDDECDTHRDCSLLEPQCLAGRCTESEATAVLVSHLNRPELLGESRSIHALQLARFNQGWISHGLRLAGIEGTSWWQRHGDDGVSFMAHHSGLVAVAVNDGSWAALAQPNDLRTSHPFRRLDLGRSSVAIACRTLCSSSSISVFYRNRRFPAPMVRPIIPHYVSGTGAFGDRNSFW